MLIDNEDELKKKKEEARQLRNSFGMITDNDKKIYDNDNFSFSDSTSSISNKHNSEDFSTTQNNSYSQRLEEAKKIRNSFGMSTTKDSGNDDFMNFSKDDDTITTIHQKDDNNISGTPKYYDTNIDNIEKTANTDTSINENTETQGESKTKKTDNNPSITRKVDQHSYKNIGLSVANPEQTQNAKPIVDYTLQQQKEEKDSQNIFVKTGTWIKDLFGSIGVSIKNTATGLYKTAKEGYDERKEAVDNMSESDIQNSSNKNKILADTIAPNTFLTNTNNNENLNSQKTKLIINDTMQDVSRSTANGLIGIANNVLNFLTFGTLSKDTIKKIPDFSVLQNSEQYGEYSSQEELTNSIQNDKKQDLADYGLYNPSANAVADITVDIAEFLLLKKAGLGSTSAMVTSGTANTLGETGNVEDATKSAVSNYVFSKVLDNKLINEKLGNAVFNGTKGKVVEALGKHGELLDADTQMKIVKGLSSASATFSETFVSRILTNELQAVGDYGNDVYNKDVQKNILVDGVIWSAIYAGISGFSGAYAKVDVEQSNINDAEAKKQLETCYSIMELDSSKEYTIEELNKQRKELVKKYHPDLAGGNNEKMAIINNAYDVLNKYITEGVIDKVVIHTESSNTPPKEDNIKEKQNGMVVTKDGQIYVDSNDILKQTATNIAKSQISPAITTIVDKDNNLTGLEQVNVVPFEVENSKVPTITPAIYVSDDGSINVIDTNTGTKLLTNAKDADTAIETVTKALQSNDESNIRNIENEVTKNSIQVEQAIGNIIDKINEKTGENNAPDISQENQDDYFSSTFGNMPDINEDSSENSFYSSPTSYIPQEQSTNIEANNAIKNSSTGSTENYIKPENHTNMEDRTYENVGNKNVLPYQAENPEISQDIKDMAANFMEDLAYSITGERYKAGDTWTGQKRSTTKELANFKDLTGASWDKISKVLNDIYDGNGNYALAKKMELELDQALSEGYTNIHGKVIMPNNEYLKKKSKIEGKEYSTYSDSYNSISNNYDNTFSLKKNNDKLAKKNNVKYNSNGIQLGKKEYMQLKSAINTDTPNLKKGINYKSLGNYFYIFDKYAFDNYNVLGRIKIIGNEKIINEILKGVDKKDDAGTKNINKLLEHSQNEQGIYTIDNINAVDSRGTAENDKLPSRAIQENESTSNRRTNNIEKSDGNNRLKIENSEQGSFNLHKNDISQESLSNSIENLKNAKGKIDRDDIINISSSLNVYHKGTTYIDKNMKNKAGKNKMPQIVDIDEFFTQYIDKEDLRKQAYKYAFDNYKNKTVLIKDIDDNVDISQSGLKKTFGKNQDNTKMQTANNLPKLIEESIYLNSSISTKNSNIVYHYFYVPISINNENQLAMITVKEDLTNKGSNSKFYYHDIREIKNIKKDFVHAMPHKDVSNMLFEQNPSITNSITQNNKSVKNTAITNNSMQKIKNDTSSIIEKKANNGGLTKKEYDNHGNSISPKIVQFFKESKVRDDKGNLMVMYHGTEANAGIPKEYWFTKFDIDKAGNHGNMLGDGFYFTSDKSHAKQYAHLKGNIYETYLNIKNPLEVKYFNSGDLAYSIRNINPYIEPDIYARDGTLDGYKVKKYLIDNGYDGIHSGNTYVAFYSNQIKNIDNNSPTNNDDIRYMKKSRASAQSKLQETDNNGRELSKQQQEYFKNSKIRDDKGNLLTLYHGSKNDFTIFDISESGKSNKNAKVGFWFTTSQEGANNFANSVWYGKNENSKAYEIYLNVTNPKIYEPIDNQKSLDNMNKKLHDLSELIRKAENKNIFLEIEKNRIKYASDDELNYIVKKYYSKEQEQQKFLEDIKQYKDLINKYKAIEKKYDNDKYNDSYEQFRTDIYKYANKEAADANFGGTGMYLENENEILKKYRDNLIKQGYDGIIIKNTTYDSKTMGKNNTQYVAFYPEQIKNIDNTSPTNNVDIRYLKSLTSQDSVSKINVNNIPKAVDTELGKTNAEREDSYIEKEIQKVESKGNWDNSIPVTKLSDINKTIEDYLQLKIKKGRFRQDAYGIYKDKRDVLRVQEYKDIDTALHEAGHAMDLGKRINVDKESISEELLNAIDKYGGYEGEPRSIKLDEGFAEVIREYGIKPEEAKKDYPNTIAILENMRMQDKSFDDFISKVQKMTYNYIHQSPRNRTLSNISVGEQTDKKVWNKKTIKTEIMRNIFDSDYALKTAVADLAKASGKKVSDIKATENAYILTRLASGIGERVTSILADGLIDENGEKRFEGLNKIGDILGKNSERYNDLRAYLVAQRDTEYKARTLRTGIRSMDSQSVINQFKNDSQIKEASKIIYNALDGVLQYAVDNHLLTSENAEALRESNAFYVPMQRVLENDRGNNVGNRGRVDDIIKKRTGSELDVKDVLENIISNSSNIIRQVENNNVLKALYKQGEESGLTGAVYDVIPAPMFKVGTQTLATWEKELKRQGVNTENLDLQKSIDIFSPSNKVDSKNLITSFIDDNGKRKYLQFYDEDVFNNLMGMDRKFMSKILSISSKLNMPLRSGATIRNIGFAIPNMISDTAQAAVYSTAGFIPIVDNAIGVLNILAVENKHVEKFLNQIAPEYEKKVNFIYELYKQSGAPSSTRLSQYRKSTQSIMNEIYGTKSSTLGIKESFKPLKRILDILAYIPDISEQSTRFRVYQKNYNYYKSKCNSEMDSRIMAAIESRDATQDFGRTGNITREINQLITFSAARVGSSYTFAEKVSENPKKVGFRIAMLTATALAISAMGYNSTKIQELNQRKKDDNFVFDIGDNVITIKKPQGVLRSIINLAEYIQDLATGHIEEGKEGERLGTWLNNAIMDNMPADEVTGLVPNAVAPLIENAINKDFYYNTDIVKSYDLDLPESEQYYDYNSQLSKWIGSIFNYSPAKIDNLISGYFGGLGTSVTNTIDYVLGKMGVIPEQAEMGAERNSVGKRFFVNVNSNSKSLDELYNTKDELTKKKNGGTITSEETKQLEKINEASSQIADINKKIKSIKSDEYLDGQEKAEKIKALQSERTDTARQALGKELMDTSNKTRIESTKFYPSNSTLKQNKYTLTLTDEMKNEYERIAYERYSQYSGQGLYNEDYLQKLETKCKDYAKNYMMQKYKSQLVKSK